MRFRGTYQKNLFRLLFAAAIVISLVLCVLMGWFLRRQSDSDYRHYLEQSALSQESASTISANIILRAVNECLKGSALTDWADAGSLPEFYFYAIGVSEALQKSTTDTMQIQYQFAVTPLNPPSFEGQRMDMVVTSVGSMTTDTYCRSESISQEDWRRISDYFQSGSAPVLLPHYDPESGELLSFHYILKLAGKQRPVLLFISVPKATFISDLPAESFFLFNSDGILAHSSSDETVRQENRLLYENLLQRESLPPPHKPQSVSDHYLITTTIAPFQWQLVSIYPPHHLDISTLLKFSLAAFLVVAVVLSLSYWMMERLYSPVEELLNSAPMRERSEKTVDEFQIIRANMEKITELGDLLHTTMEENNSLMSIQSYKELLFAQNPRRADLEPFDEPMADYCVALGETLSPTDEYAFQAIALQKGITYDFVARRDNLFFINLDYNRYALIIRASSQDTAKAILNALLRQMESDDRLADSEHRIVLSDIHQGLNQLHVCYQEALRILEYRYLHTNSRLITYQEISSIDAVTYSYPLQTENRLIQCALDGKEEAIVIFENVIRENIRDKDLSKETLQNLIYALIGTLSRIFQELKTSPEELLGRKLDYKYLYNHWNDSAVFIQIKEVLEEIIHTVSQRESCRSQELLDKMLGYIYQNYSDNIMLNDLADYLNISPKYCGILFKQLSDNNFKDFLNRYRVEKSIEILKENPSIKILDLSTMVGFNSSNSFIRVFNKYVGVSPGAFAERLQH